jgi:hypothetical protein
MIDEGAHDLIKIWWDTTTTISPNWKDLKIMRINAKMFATHAIQYLQESHVFILHLETILLFELMFKIPHGQI